MPQLQPSESDLESPLTKGKDLEDAPNTVSSTVVHLEYFPRAIAIVAAAMAISTFSIFFATATTAPDKHFKGDGWRPASKNFLLPTISRTGAIEPTSAFFTAGLHLICFLFLPIVLYVFQSMKQQIQVCADFHAIPVNDVVGLGGRSVLSWNRFARNAGFVCAFGLFGTGTMYIGLNGAVHTFLAGVLFLSGNLYAFVLTFGVIRPLQTQWQPQRESGGKQQWGRFWLRFKMICIGVGFINVILFVFVFTVVQFEDGCMGFNWCSARNWKSVSEYFVTTALMMFILSMQHELRGAKLSLIPDRR
jgi:hypothetical protein